MRIGMLIFENIMQLDLTAPFEVFCRMPDADVFLVAESLFPVRSDGGLALLPTASFESSPQYDVLFVPGGPGILSVMQDEKALQFLRHQAERAQYITSVCTGSLVLAAAGLLRGYRATTHWLSIDLLKLFPEIEVVEERVVIDRNRMTGGGVTAGLDFGLALVAALHGDAVAQEIQLMLEYNPQPPFNAGSPYTTDAAIVGKTISQRRDIQEQRKRAILDIIAKG